MNSKKRDARKNILLYSNKVTTLFFQRYNIKCQSEIIIDYFIP